jgi:hypothetical protein
MLVDILLDHYMLTCGGDYYAAEISDLFIFEFKRKRPTCCMPLIFTTRAGKQNQHGRLETINRAKVVILRLPEGSTRVASAYHQNVRLGKTKDFIFADILTKTINLFEVFSTSNPPFSKIKYDILDFLKMSNLVRFIFIIKF